MSSIAEGASPLPEKVPGYVHHIPYPSVPVPPAELRRFRAFVNALLTELMRPKPLQALYLVHPLKIPPDVWREENRKFAICWEWESGQAVRLIEPPDGKPAQKSKSVKFMEDLAKAFPEELSTLPASMRDTTPRNAEIVHLLRQNEDFTRIFPKQQWFSPMEVFLGNGGCTLYLVEDPELFFKLGKAITITKSDPGLGSLDFAVPFFQLEDFDSASPETLEIWFRLFEVYISENREDRGLVVASRHDIGSIIERVQSILTGNDDYKPDYPIHGTSGAS
jgi:hypothetical protein